MVALLVVAVLVLAVVLAVCGASRRGAVVRVRGAWALSWLALVLILTGAGMSVPLLLGDANPLPFTLAVLAVPVMLAAAPLLTARSRPGGITTWSCAVMVVGLALVFGLGVGLFILPGALVLLIAAGLSGCGGRKHETDGRR